MDTSPIKSCWRCGLSFPAQTGFYRGGKDTACKQCRHALNKEWAHAHKAEINPKRSLYMQKYRARKSAQKKIDKLRDELEKAKASAGEGDIPLPGND